MDANANDDILEIDDDIEMEFDAETGEPIAMEVEDEVVEDDSFDANLALLLDEDTLREIGQARQEALTNFKNARADWESYIKDCVRWLGLTVSADAEGDLAVEGGCAAVHPILIENVVKFQAKAIQELWPAKGPVRTKIRGLVTPQREAAASRVRNHMNYQLTEQVPGVYSDFERNLFRVGFMGNGIRKAVWNAGAQAPDPVVVAIENFYVDPAVSHLRHAPEYIELMELNPLDMQSKKDSGLFCGHDEQAETLSPNELTEAVYAAMGIDASIQKLGYLVGESHCYLDLNGLDPLVPAGAVAPYVVHFNVGTGTIYAIRRNWEPTDDLRTKVLWYTHDEFIPAFGFYSFGYAHLIGQIAASATATLRTLVDSGQYANWQGGFKSKDAKFTDSDTPLAFGEFRDVDLSPEDMQKAFVPIPAKDPSQVLFQLLQFMVASGQKFADAADEVVQNGTNYGPVGTTLALLEASQRFYSSIHKRLHNSQHEFFKLLARLNFKYLPARVNFVVNNENEFVQATDYNPDAVDVIPASDPNALSESQRVARAQIELDMAAKFPQHHDIREALRRFYSAMGTEGIDKLMPDPASRALTADPMSELQAAMTGRPIKAQMGQNHSAHIAVKEAFLKSPQMQGVNDPSTATGLEILKANIAEHKVLMFVAQAMQLAQAQGGNIQDENVQGAIATQMLQISAESGMAGSGPSAEQQMIELNREELEIARQRIQSQDVRESAKLALKAEELMLKKLDLQSRLRLDAATKVLEHLRATSDTQQEQLRERVESYEQPN